MNGPPISSIRVTHQHLQKFVTDCALRIGLPQDQSTLLGRLLVDNDLRGVNSHGSRLMLTYARSFQKGELNCTPHVRVVDETDVSLRVDGDGGMGYFPMYEGTPLLIDKVKERGIGVLITCNHGHIGAAAIYARLTLKHDLLTFITSGHQLRLHKSRNFNQVGGHSPMCFTAPAGSEDALVLDCGVTNDIGWPDESPEKLMNLAPGLVLRSIGMGTVCQAWGGLLSGLPLDGSSADQKYRAAGQGAMMICFKISLFMPPDQFKKEMDAYARAARKLQPPKGNDQTYLPGGIEARRHREYLENGIPIGDDHRGWLDTLAAELEIPVPW